MSIRGKPNELNEISQPNLSRSLVATGNVDQAAIFNDEGSSVWAASPGFTVKPEEMSVIVASFKDPSTVQASGFHVAGQKYITIQASPDNLYGRKVRLVRYVRFKSSTLIARAGQGEHHNRQDWQSSTCCTLARYSPGWKCRQHC